MSSDRYKEWLEDFHREVEAELAKPPTAPQPQPPVPGPADENARLKTEMDRLSREHAALRDAQASLQGRLADMDAKSFAARGDYETKSRALHDVLQTLHDNKALLDGSIRRIEARLQAVEELAVRALEGLLDALRRRP